MSTHERLLHVYARSEEEAVARAEEFVRQEMFDPLWVGNARALFVIDCPDPYGVFEMTALFGDRHPVAEGEA